jgi:fructosamine-3-kinase
VNAELPAAVRAALAEAHGHEVVSARPVAGGCINEAWRVELSDATTLFVKGHPDPPPAFFQTEADGLAWLADGLVGDTIGVPRAISWRDDHTGFLAVEWVEPGARTDDEVDQRLGRGLAALHRAGAPSFGWDRDGYIGDLPQANDAHDSWAAFYRARRLEPLARRAIDRGTLPSSATPSFDRLFARLDELVGPPEPPARLHGDLWSGNRLVDAHGRSWLIDPAPYGGHREVDLAMMRLFGGFGEAAFAAYHEAYPLADGHRERVALYQLYPLLVHVTLFGGGYATQTLAALDRARRAG